MKAVSSLLEMKKDWPGRCEKGKTFPQQRFPTVTAGNSSRSNMDLHEVQTGKCVNHVAHPGRLGVLTGAILETWCPMAEVNWGSEVEFVDVAQLHEFDPKAHPDVDSDVRSGRYGTIDDLRRRITFEKLRGLLTDVFYSMKTSEIDFYPHQFKPVLRFIESATNRLLIADEVGLGKTIESGLIWTEWQAREKARRLLVVCEPTICPKWLRELQERFQLPAEYADAKRLADLLDLFDRRGPGLSFVLVTSYQALRPFRKERALLEALRESGDEIDPGRQRLPPRVKLLQRLSEWDSADHFIDLVVFDEATAMKNTASASYAVGEVLSAAAGATLCLSATPIHNQSRDLYALLRLIDPEVFRDQFVFDLLRGQNLPVVRLQNALSQPGWRPQEVRPLIEALSEGESRRQLLEVLAQFDGTPRQRVELRHAVERMNLLGNFINRTRKREVIENRVIRLPVTFPVEFKPEEAAFYKAVLALVRSEVRNRGDRVTSFHLIHPAMRMSSCLPGIALEVREGRWGGFEEMQLLAEDFASEFDEEGEGQIPPPAGLSELSRFDFEKHDSKYAALREALRLITEKGKLPSDKGGNIAVASTDKIIIFAFFKSTIRYLHRRLEADGFRVVAVTGDITDKDERDRILQRFGEDQNRILLCSEIGAAGVDLQFARVVVNYDLPWNPMKVEQRIGRIDRIGQEAATVAIVNFHVRDTIDGIIFSHLYSKIGVFEQTIGALEGILGEEVAKLTAQIFREDLTPEQVAQRADQTAGAVLERARQEAELEQSAGALIAFQDLLSEQIGESQRLGRFIKPRELRLHLDDFLSARFTGSDACLLVWGNPAPDCLELTLSFRALSSFEDFCRLHDYEWPDGFSRTTRSAVLTLDPAVHQRLKRQFRRLTLVTHLHPFFRWITAENERATNNWHKVSAVRVMSSDFTPGLYFYLIYRLTLDGITRRDGFHYGLKSLATGEVLTGIRAEALLNQSLDDGESAFLRQPADHSPDLAQLRELLARELKAAQRAFREDQAQKLEIRRRQITSHFDRRIEAQRRRIATLERSPDAARRGLPGFKRQLENLVTERERQLERLRQKAASISERFAEVACGLLEVRAGGGANV
ncbi:MAG: DEAD/DEAH box helicase family protein [Verrucomicrobia bacterium]|nr:DEAD/DEAH box helicase family protein [Verrucomicrobiota bacterium]